MRIKWSGNKAFILVFALWTLSILTILAISIASGVRQKIMLVQKLENRSRMQALMLGAVASSKVYLRHQLSLSDFAYTPLLKMSIHNNPTFFNQIAVGEDAASIGYLNYYGFMDEEQKININTASQAVLERLIERVVVGLRPSDASILAAAILDWRKFGEGQLTGFYSDAYYANLQFPYKKKDADYELLDELLLVRGMTKDIYEQLRGYVTIYGDGKVNINTAQAPVLYALGLDDVVIVKLLSARRGKDGLDFTPDDIVFSKTFDIASEVNAQVKLLPQEARSIDALNLQGLLSVTSNYFSAEIRAGLHHKTYVKQAQLVIAARENKIVYWREK